MPKEDFQNGIVYENEAVKKTNQMYLKGNLWKVVIRMVLPTVVMMLFFGLYNFSDTILSINFADDSYVGGSNDVRVRMQAWTPINSIMQGIMLLFGVGISTRFSVNLGAGKNQKAITTVRTGITIGLIASTILIPILILSTKPWIGATLNSTIPDRTSVVHGAYEYAWVALIGLPIIMINQVFVGLFRAEGRNREMMAAMVTPILLNLFLDWLLMGPGGMNIQGGAIATVVANTVSTLLFLGFIVFNKKKKTLITLKNLFRGKIKLITLVGVMLVGIGPFVNGASFSFTGSIQTPVISDTSHVVYRSGVDAQLPGMGEKLSGLVMFNQLSTIMPIFGLIAPAMFAVSASTIPVAAYNFGANEYKRARKAVWIGMLYTIAIGIVLALITQFGIKGLLFSALGVSKDLDITNPETHQVMATIDLKELGAYKDMQNAVWVIMITMPLMCGLIGMRIYFGSHDKFWMNIVASTLWLVTFTIMLFVFKEIAIHNTSNRLIFWFAFPATGATSSLIGIASILIATKLQKEKSMKFEEKIYMMKEILRSPSQLRAITKKYKKLYS